VPFLAFFVRQITDGFDHFPNRICKLQAQVIKGMMNGQAAFSAAICSCREHLLCRVFLQTKKPDMLTFRAEYSLGVIHVRLFGDS
jgi:hypothetical protein